MAPQDSEAEDLMASNVGSAPQTIVVGASDSRFSATFLQIPTKPLEPTLWLFHYREIGSPG